MAEKDLVLKLKAQDDMSATLGKLGKVMTEAFAVKKILDFGKAIFDSFSDSESALIRFNAVMDNTTGSTEALRKQFLAVANSAVKFGIDDEVVAESLANLYTKTGDATSALNLHQLALNITAQTGKSYSESIDLINGTMAGKTIPLIKELGLNLEESADPLKVLQSAYEKTFGTADKTLNSAKTATARFKESMDNLRTALAETLARAVVPIINGVSSLISKFENLPSGVKTTISAITTLSMVAGTLILLFSALSTVIPALTAGFVAFKAVMMAVSGPIGIIVGGLSLVVGGLVAVGSKMGWFKNASDSATASNTEFAKSLGNMKDGAVKVSDSVVKMTEDLKKVSDQIKTLNKDFASSVIASGEKQLSLNQDIGDAIVEQQTKVSDLEKEIAEEKKKFIQDQDTAKLNNLTQQLAKEQLALQTHNDILVQYETNVAEAKRRVSLTEFERRIEDLNNEKLAEQKRLKERFEEYQLELKQLKEQQALILAENKKFTDQIKKDAQERADAEMNSAMTIQNARAIAYRNSVSTLSADLAKYSGQTISSGSTKSVKDALISPNGDIITTDPNDYIIATKNPKSLGQNGGGIVINVYGDISGQNLIDEISNKLMQRLRVDTKFSV